MTFETRKAIGERIRELRKENNLSQETLALMAGVESSYLAKVERGERNPTVDLLEKITASFGLSLFEFFNSI